MKLSDLPTRIQAPFGNSAGGGYIQNPIPIASQIGIQDGRASFTDGFVPLNFLPVGAGGVPPYGADMNGILYMATAWNRWQSAGGFVPYNSGYASAIGGYPKGGLLASTSFSGFWLNTADDNTGDPEAGAANWLKFYPYFQETLTANRTYYVSTTGNDANDGSSGSPWATLQHAWDFVRNNINLNGFIVTIQMANGTYTASLNASGALTGSSGPASFVIQGNLGAPQSVVLNTTDDCIIATAGAAFTVKGVQLQSTGANGALNAGNGGIIHFLTVRFGATTNAHVYASQSGIANIAGSYAIVGSAGTHFTASTGGVISSGSTSITVTLSGTPAFTTFANAVVSSIINIRTTFVTFSGSATGVRYNSTLLSNIYTAGGGANYFPGNSGGTTGTSGIYN